MKTLGWPVCRAKDGSAWASSGSNKPLIDSKLSDMAASFVKIFNLFSKLNYIAKLTK